MTFKVFVSFLLFISNDIFCQDMQIVMETKSYFNAPVVGKINLYQTTFLAKNQKNTREVTSIEKRLFGFLAGLISDVNDTTGHLITFDGKQWGYNKNNKEYWDYLKKQSSEKNNENNSKSVSFSVGDSDDEFLFISRKEHEGVEKIHGFQTKKYTTIFETMKNRIKIDEWAVKELSLLRIADTLNKDLLILLGTPDSIIMASTYGAGLSNNEAVIGSPKLDSLFSQFSIEPITGEIIKGDVKVIDKESEDTNLSFGTEVVALYAEDFEIDSFNIGNDYVLIDH